MCMSWCSDANCLVTVCVCVCVCVCVEGATNDVGGVRYSVWESSDFTWGVCVNAGTPGSLKWGFVCFSVCVCVREREREREGSPVTHKGGCFWLWIGFNQSSLMAANHLLTHSHIWNKAEPSTLGVCLNLSFFWTVWISPRLCPHQGP